MTLRRLVRSEVDAECLADLLVDARAIPTAAYGRSTHAAATLNRIQTPARRVGVRIPDEMLSLVEAGNHQWPDYHR